MSNCCFFCSGNLVQQAAANQVYWYCIDCRQKLSERLVSASQGLKTRIVNLSDAQEQYFTIAAEPKILCAYSNRSNLIKVVSAKRSEIIWFERTVFPGEVLLFEVPRKAWVEVYTNDTPNVLLSEHIPCEVLQINSTKQMHSVKSSGESCTM
jgi:Domain of unknown function (DUF1830)